MKTPALEELRHHLSELDRLETAAKVAATRVRLAHLRTIVEKISVSDREFRELARVMVQYKHQWDFPTH